MRAKEFVQEAKSKRGQLKKAHRRSIPSLEIWPELDNNNHPYLAYRFGIAMAAAPREQDMDPNGPVGSNFTTVAYTNGEAEIFKSAAKIVGAKSIQLTTTKSLEPKSTNSVSPVANWNKHQVKKK